MIRVRLIQDKLSPMFALFYFSGTFGRAQILSTTKQVTISGIDSQQLKSLLICLPPLDEQENILEKIRKDESSYLKSKQKIETVIERLKEYRTALITQAVTGKIDVRNVPVPAQPEAEAA